MVWTRISLLKQKIMFTITQSTHLSWVSGEITKLFADAGIIYIASLISPYTPTEKTVMLAMLYCKEIHWVLFIWGIVHLGNSLEMKCRLVQKHDRYLVPENWFPPRYYPYMFICNCFRLFFFCRFYMHWRSIRATIKISGMHAFWKRDLKFTV